MMFIDKGSWRMAWKSPAPTHEPDQWPEMSLSAGRPPTMTFGLPDAHATTRGIKARTARARIDPPLGICDLTLPLACPVPELEIALRSVFRGWGGRGPTTRRTRPCQDYMSILSSLAGNRRAALPTGR